MMPTFAPTKSFSAARHSLASSGRGISVLVRLSKASAEETSRAADELKPAPIGTSP